MEHLWRLPVHPQLDAIPSPNQGDDRLYAFFWTAVAISLLLPRLPYGRRLLYPFALLGTWAHELGHGVAAVFVGGSFERLLIYPNLGGTAYSSGVGRLGKAVVAAGGLLGPALAGGLFILLGSREGSAPAVLAALAVTIVVSLLLVVRNAFGWAALVVLAAALAAVAVYAPSDAQILLAQLLGIQFCFASLGTLDYMFTKDFVRGGRVIESDTQQIANALLLPYWFWGAAIAATSAAIMAGSFYLAWVRA